MPIDLTSARAAAASYLLGDAFTIVRVRLADDGAGGTTPHPAGPERIGPLMGAFSAVSGDEAADTIVAVRGRYRLKCTVATDIRATDLVEIVGRTYAVVWDPPPAALSLFRVVGLTEA